MQPLPVRTRLTVLPDGATASASFVYCERQGRSVPFEQCMSCPHAGAIELVASGRERTVECACVSLVPSERPHEAGMAAVVAAVLPVGLALAHTVTCVANDVPLHQAARRVAMDASALGVPVVDAQGVLAGLLPRASVTLAMLASSGEVVGDRMVAPMLSVLEGDSLGDAFRSMCARRLRELVVVSSTGQVVGLLRDVDAMRFVAHVTRTGVMPGREDDAA
jgi:CBS domain-containing protein